MKLDGIIGNQDAVRALKGMAESGRIPHAMMIYENDGCGAMAIVLAFLSEVFADEHKVSGLIHPDVHYVYPVANGSKVSEKVDNLRAELFLGYWRTLISENPYALESEVSFAFGIEGKQAVINNAEAKEILETIYLSPVEGGYKAVVVYLPEKMNAASANRLLKAVEEPPEKTLFIMVTHAPEKVMQTISSRCQAIRILPSSKEEIARVLTERFGKTMEEATRAALTAGGSVGTALHALSDMEDGREHEELFRSMMDALVARNLGGLLDCGDAIASLGSREKQKAFCKFAGESLRKIFLIQQGMKQLAALSAEEEPYMTKLAGSCRKAFPRMAIGCLDRASQLIDRNVNQKILFCELVGRLYMIF
jgi:DNA polymerase III, gamma/tau subunits